MELLGLVKGLVHLNETDCHLLFCESQRYLAENSLFILFVLPGEKRNSMGLEQQAIDKYLFLVEHSHYSLLYCLFNFF